MTTMKKLKLHILPFAIGFLILAATASAQSSFTPQNLGKTVNSEYSEINPVISVDGKTLYFSRANHPGNTLGRFNSQDVWFSTLNEDGTWTEAQRLPKEINI